MVSLMESIRKMQRKEITEAVKFDGRTFKNTKVFNDDDSANDFMQKNKDWGVIGVKGGKVYLAPHKDMGEGFEYENLDEARKKTFRDYADEYEKLTGKKAPAGTSTQAMMIILDKAKREMSEEVKLEEAKKQLDRVDRDELKKDYEDREDKDIDNDGDEDDSDRYLHSRRKAVSKALAKEEASLGENYELVHDGKRVDYFDSKEEAEAALDKMDLSDEDREEYTINKVEGGIMENMVWSVAVGNRKYRVTAKSTVEASKRAKMTADKEGNKGVVGKIVKLQ